MGPNTQLDPAPRVTVGSANAELVIDRVSNTIERFVGEPPSRVVGRRLFDLLDVDDPAVVVQELRAAQTAIVSRQRARMRARNGAVTPGQLVLHPLAPAPSCIFTFSLSEPVEPRPAHTGQLAPHRARPQLDSITRALTDREHEIVTLLVNGDRVPHIARQLFVSQSTVRNLLSSTYRKLGVSSQQELVHLLRPVARAFTTLPAGRS